MPKVISATFGGKSPFKSLTAWGLVVYAVGDSLVETACGPTGVLPSEACAQLAPAVESLGAILAALGIRKAATAPNVK